MNQKTQTFKGFWRAFALPLVSCSAKCNTQRSNTQCSNASAQRSSVLHGSATVTLLLVFVLGLLVSGCGKSNGPGRKVKGNGIAISATTLKQSNGATKTVYGTRPSGGGTQPIYWADGDHIILSCAQALSSEGAALTTGLEYEAVPTSDKSKALIYPANNGNGLWWKDATTTHNIFGLYPAPSQNSSASLSLTGTAAVTMPSTQTLTKADGFDSATDKVFNPNMDYAYLWSGVSTKKTNSVGMTFKPGFTAFEFTVGNAKDEAITLNSFTLSSTSCALAGDFSIAITAANPSTGSTATYTVPAFADGTNNAVTVNLANTAITKTQTLTFTVFALPASRLSGKTNILTDLKISFDITVGGQSRTRSLLLKYKADHSDASKAGKPIEITGTSKAYITFTLPDFKNITLTIFEIKDIDDIPTVINFGEHNLDVEQIDETHDGWLLM